MRKKTLVAVIILCLAAVTMAHSFGFGVQANFKAGGVFAPGASLLISPSSVTHLAINWYIDLDKVNTVGLTLDVAPLCLPIVSARAASLNFTLGIGLYTNVIFTDDPGVTGGLRVPIGLNIMLGPKILEVFTHVAPSFGIRFLPSLRLSSPFYPIALGARIWFR